MMYRRRDQHNFLCVLAVNAQILNLNGIVISDQNAARNYAKFIAPNEMETALDFEIIYIRDWNDDDAFEKSKRKAIKCAEHPLLPGVKSAVLLSIFLSVW